MNTKFYNDTVNILEHFSISNISSGPFSIYGQTPYKLARYLELRYLELFATSDHFLVPRTHFARCNHGKKLSGQLRKTALSLTPQAMHKQFKRPSAVSVRELYYIYINT